MSVRHGFGIDLFRVYAYNPNQMFLPNHDKVFGSHFLKIVPPTVKSKDDRAKNYYQEYDISRTHWKSVDRPEFRCNSRSDKENTTKCLTEYLENKIGCSMGLQGSLSGSKKLSVYIKVNASRNDHNPFTDVTQLHSLKLMPT